MKKKKLFQVESSSSSEDDEEEEEETPEYLKYLETLDPKNWKVRMIQKTSMTFKFYSINIQNSKVLQYRTKRFFGSVAKTVKI